MDENALLESPPLAADGIAMPLVDIAIAYRDAGLSVIATRADKTPATSWKYFEKNIATDKLLAGMFLSTGAAGVGIICGAVSGNLECLDFDDGGSAFEDWFAAVAAVDADLAASLVVESTPSGGRHVIYRCCDEAIDGNHKIAAKRSGECLIETRGEGGYFVAAPSPGYQLLQGDFRNIPTVTPDERDTLLRSAAAFDRMPASEKMHRPPPAPIDVGHGRPGDDFNHRGDIREALQRNGWTFWRQCGENEAWTRPGKDKGISATLRNIDGVDIFFVFSTSTSFEAMRGYTPFQAVAILEHGGDYAAAAAELRRRGFGEAKPAGDAAATPAGVAAAAKPIMKILSEWAKEGVEKPKTIIAGVIGRGDKLQIVGPSKSKKSWFLGHLALSLATGNDFLHFSIPKPVRTAVLQFEIREQYYYYRLENQCKGMGLDIAAIPNFAAFNMRGRTLDEAMPELVAFKPDVVCLDPLYKLYGEKHDENSAGDVARLLARFDRMANEMDAAIVFTHHDNKNGGLVGETVNRGAGSGVLGRDFDAAFFLSPHATIGDAIVVEPKLRNFPPRCEFTAVWQNYVFAVDNEVMPIAASPITMRAKAQRGPLPDEIAEHVAQQLFADGQAKGVVEAKNYIQDQFGVGEKKAESTIKFMCETMGFVRRREGRDSPYLLYPAQLNFGPQLVG